MPIHLNWLNNMTQECLINNGWESRECRIGTLFFKGDFFINLKENGIAAVFRCSNDMKPIGFAGTLNDIKELQKKSDLEEIELLEATLSLMKLAFEKKYNEKFIEK